MSAEIRRVGKSVVPGLTQRGRWQLRWPRLAVLRLEGVLAWVFVGSGAAWLLAPWFVGNSTQQIGSAYDYMTIWVALSLGVACYWVYLQWRDRPGLPPHRPLGLSWSVAVNFMVLSTVFSVVPIAGQAAEHHIRSLRSPDELREEFKSLRSRPDCEIRIPIGRWGVIWGRRMATGDMDNSFWKDKVVLLPLVSIDQYLLPAELQTPNECLTPEDLLHRYLSDASLQAKLACIDEKLNNLSEYSTCRDAYSSPHDGPEEAQSKMRCGADVLLSCNKKALYSTWLGNFASLLMAHNIEFRHSTSTDPVYLLQLGVLAMLLATIAGCAGVFQASVAGATFLVLALLAFLIPAVVSTLTGDDDGAGRAARVVGLLAYAGLLIPASVNAVARRARSDLLDLAVILVCVGPLFILVLEARINLLEFWTCASVECKQALWPFPHLYPYAMLAWTALVGFALSWYRTLPTSR